MKRILVVRFGSLGDVILASSAVLNLKLGFPSARLTFLTKERFAPVVSMMDGVDETAALPEGAGAAGLTRLLLDLDRRNYDAVVDVHGNFRSWLTRKMVAAPYAAVYPKRRWERRRLVRERVRPTEWPHTIDMYNRAVAAIGGPTLSRRPVLRTDPSAGLPEGAKHILERFRQVVLVSPGAAHENKRWPIERFAAVAQELCRNREIGLIWAVTGADAGKGPKLSNVAADRQAELIDFPIPQLAAVIERCSITFANDSGLAHVSSAVGTPVAAMFGPTHPALGFSPRGLFDRVIEVDEPCRPCSLHGAKPCWRDERYCFTRITPERVVEEAMEMLDRRTREAPALFVDRDGTVMVDRDYLSDPAGVELIPGAVEGLRAASNAGYRIVIVSNQSGVARGMFSIEAVERVNGRLRELLHRSGVMVDGMYYCPHYPQGQVAEFAGMCECRKPSAGMIERAARELGINVRRSWVIGDKRDDVSLARVAGARGALVRTGYGTQEEKWMKAQGNSDGRWVADDLSQAMGKIISGEWS